MKKWTHGTIGSVSHATMRKEDLIPSFVDELRFLGHRDKKLSLIEYRLERAGDEYWEDELSDFDLESLFDMLQEHALPYMYFGSHPGDGSDYGFWILEGIEYDFDGLQVEDTSDIPSDYIGEVLHINERGNMTLYSKTARKLTEIWAIV